MLSNMIGIIGAMEIEIEGLRAKLEDAQSETISGIRFDWGTINGTPCTLAVCGPGKVNAAVCAQTMILRFHPQLVINSGVAGGIGPDVHIKDVVIATAVVQHDMDTSPLGDPVGLISGLNIIEIPADETAAEVLTGKAHEVYEGNVFHGIIATGDQFMADRSKIAAIAEQFQPVIVYHFAEVGGCGLVCFLGFFCAGCERIQFRPSEFVPTCPVQIYFASQCQGGRLGETSVFRSRIR